MKNSEITNRKNMFRRVSAAVASLAFIAGLGVSAYSISGADKVNIVHGADSEITGAVTETVCGVTEVSGDVTEFKCDVTGDITEATCDVTGAVTEVNYDVTGAVTEVKCDVTGDITEAKCDAGRADGDISTMKTDDVENEDNQACSLDPDDMWSYWNKGSEYYPEGYTFDHVISEGSRVPYLCMKNENGDKSIFRANIIGKNMDLEWICSESDGTFSVSQSGELYRARRDANGMVCVEQITGDKEKMYLPDLGENAQYYVVGDNQKICLNFRDGNEPYCVFFDNEGNIKNEVLCDLYGQPYNPDVKISYTGSTCAFDGTTMLCFSINAEGRVFNGYCCIDSEAYDFSLIFADAGCKPAAVNSGVYDMEYLVYDRNDEEIYGYDIEKLFGDESMECCFLHVSDFYENCDDIRYFNVPYDGKFWFFFDDHADIISDTGYGCCDGKMVKIYDAD